MQISARFPGIFVFFRLLKRHLALEKTLREAFRKILMRSRREFRLNKKFFRWNSGEIAFCLSEHGQFWEKTASDEAAASILSAQKAFRRVCRPVKRPSEGPQVDKIINNSGAMAYGREKFRRFGWKFSSRKDFLRSEGLSQGLADVKMPSGGSAGPSKAFRRVCRPVKRPSGGYPNYALFIYFS